MTGPTANSIELSAALEALAALGLGTCILYLIRRRTELRFNNLTVASLSLLSIAFATRTLTVFSSYLNLGWDLSVLTIAGALSWTLFALTMMSVIPDTLRLPTRGALLRIRRSAERRVQEMSRLHSERESDLLHQATRDGLTDVLRRGPIMSTLDEACRREGPGNVAVMMIDLDDFKSVNDTYGHTAGDRILRASACAIREVLRNGDYVGRYGGEEFLVVLRASTVSSSQQIAERIRSAIEDIGVPFEEEVIHATCSIGVAVFGREDPARTLHRADQALYVSKRTGKNSITFLPDYGDAAMTPSVTVRPAPPSVPPSRPMLITIPTLAQGPTEAE